MATSCPRLAGRYSPAGGYAGRVAHSPENTPTNGTKAHSKQTIRPSKQTPYSPAHSAHRTRKTGRKHSTHTTTHPGRLAAPRPQQKPRANGKRKAPAETSRRGKTILFSSSRPTKHKTGKAKHRLKSRLHPRAVCAVCFPCGYIFNFIPRPLYSGVYAFYRFRWGRIPGTPPRNIFHHSTLNTFTQAFF